MIQYCQQMLLGYALGVLAKRQNFCCISVVGWSDPPRLLYHQWLLTGNSVWANDASVPRDLQWI